MTRAHLSTTTHTVEMAQIEELNRRLQTPPRPRIAAADLGLAGVGLLSAAGSLPAGAVLTRLCWDGPPAWPYIHGHFSAGDSRSGSLVTELHTSALRELSHRLSVHQRWGV